MELRPEMLIPRLGDHLVEKKRITEGHLQMALARQGEIEAAKGARPYLGQVLVDMGAIDRDSLDAAIAGQILEFRHALEETNKNLEKTVKERTEELTQTLKKVGELNKLLIRFVSTLSHELRTPLFHITGNLELLLEEDMGQINPDQRNALTVAQRAAERLGNLIENLILFTSTEDRPLKLRLQPVPVSSLCEAVTTCVKDVAHKAEVHLHLEVPFAALSVQANPDRLTWVIRHLIENAVKYTEKNGSVTLSIREEGARVHFAVADTGIGIPPACFEEIFEPFHQLDETISRRYGGMGLGLSLARRIIRAHGTDISVSSAVGKGSSFSFPLEKA